MLRFLHIVCAPCAHRLSLASLSPVSCPPQSMAVFAHLRPGLRFSFLIPSVATSAFALAKGLLRGWRVRGVGQGGNRAYGDAQSATLLRAKVMSNGAGLWEPARPGGWGGVHLWLNMSVSLHTIVPFPISKPFPWIPLPPHHPSQTPLQGVDSTFHLYQ